MPTTVMLNGVRHFSNISEMLRPVQHDNAFKAFFENSIARLREAPTPNPYLLTPSAQRPRHPRAPMLFSPYRIINRHEAATEHLCTYADCLRRWFAARC
jgi:hypothetical protein